MKKLLITTALVLSASGAFAQSASQEAVDTAHILKEGADTANVQRNTLGANYNGDHVLNGGQGNTNHTTTVTSSTPNGYVSNPNLTTGGSDVCLGSSSGGISAAGIGISGGSTTVDENCVMLKNAKILASLGLKDAAVTLLIISNEKAAEAISLANPELFKTLTNTQ